MFLLMICIGEVAVYTAPEEVPEPIQTTFNLETIRLLYESYTYTS